MNHRSDDLLLPEPLLMTSEMKTIIDTTFALDAGVKGSIDVGTSEKVRGQHRRRNNSGQRRLLRNTSSAGQHFVEQGGWGVERRQFPRCQCMRTELPRALLHLPSPMHLAQTVFSTF